MYKIAMKSILVSTEKLKYIHYKENLFNIDLFPTMYPLLLAALVNIFTDNEDTIETSKHIKQINLVYPEPSVPLCKNELPLDGYRLISWIILLEARLITERLFNDSLLAHENLMLISERLLGYLEAICIQKRPRSGNARAYTVYPIEALVKPYTQDKALIIKAAFFMATYLPILKLTAKHYINENVIHNFFDSLPQYEIYRDEFLRKQNDRVERKLFYVGVEMFGACGNKVLMGLLTALALVLIRIKSTGFNLESLSPTIDMPYTREYEDLNSAFCNQDSYLTVENRDVVQQISNLCPPLVKDINARHHRWQEKADTLLTACRYTNVDFALNFDIRKLSVHR